MRRRVSGVDLVLVMMVLIWGINYPAIKIALRDFYPMSFNLPRFILASLFILFLLKVTEKRVPLRRRDWLPILGLAVLGHTLYQLLFIYGIYHTSVSNASVIMAVTPIFVALLSSFSRYERVKLWTWVGIFLSFFGIYLIVKVNSGGWKLRGLSYKGDFLIMGCSVCWSLYTVIAKPLLKRYSPLRLTAVSMALGTLFLIPFSFRELWQQDWHKIAPISWLALVYSFSLGIAIGYTIWYIGVARLGATRTSVYSNLVPVAAIFFAWLFLAERLTLEQLLGAAMVLVGVYLTRIRDRELPSPR